MDIPIIIFHLGNLKYVHLCLKQAKKYNNNVILITDCPEVYSYTEATCINYKNYSTYIDSFDPLYKPFSTNNPQFEFICIIRWFVAYEYMKEHKIERAFICDSDVLIYENITEINNKYLKTYDFMLCSSPSLDVTGGQSIWNFNKLQEFVIFCFKFYQTQIPNIQKWHKNYDKLGGICDMTLLYYFSHKQTEFKGLQLPNFPTIDNDLTEIFNNEITFDLHLSTYGNHTHPNDYEINKKTQNKNIKYINDKPVCFNKRLKKNIKFVLLHFQGTNNKILKDFYLKTN